MKLPETTRRVFLKRSLQSFAVLVAGPAVGSGCAPGSSPVVPGGLRVLGTADWIVLDAAADTIVPRGGAFATGARDVDLATRIDHFLADGDPELVRGVVSALWVLEWGAGLLAWHPGRFSRASLEDRSAIFEALARSRIGVAREVHAGLKQLCTFAFYSDSTSWQPIGYDGPWVADAGGAG